MAEEDEFASPHLNPIHSVWCATPRTASMSMSEELRPEADNEWNLVDEVEARDLKANTQNSSGWRDDFFVDKGLDVLVLLVSVRFLIFYLFCLDHFTLY
ncbi:hypothetical protein BDM02DRAFT_3110037 [Thelephora ganbajun]|uniref:Uncharacterized protein n=1 Tax=Thelephora ganbajun TaxID=370292 RepID=A0ACB6ZQ70_THEGA|nr:hypothetical protein BDM02DRAFT_3110037 [Thelephora ganbajun]